MGRWSPYRQWHQNSSRGGAVAVTGAGWWTKGWGGWPLKEAGAVWGFRLYVWDDFEASGSLMESQRFLKDSCKKALWYHPC